MSKIRFEAIEDNGGGLHLYVWDNDRLVYGASGLECNPGSLAETIQDLRDGGNYLLWDGCVDDPQADYDHLTEYEFGWEIVCDGPPFTLYETRMGRAALLDFGLDGED